MFSTWIRFLQSDPIIFPGGHYPRSIGVANTGIFALSRLAGLPPDCTPTITGAASLDHIDFANRIADTPCTLSAGLPLDLSERFYQSTDGVLTSSPANDYLLLALADGNVVEYDDSAPNLGGFAQGFHQSWAVPTGIQREPVFGGAESIG